MYFFFFFFFSQETVDCSGEEYRSIRNLTLPNSVNIDNIAIQYRRNIRKLTKEEENELIQ